MLTNLLLFWAGIATLAFSIAMILYRNARKDIRKHIEQNTEQSRRHMELSQKFNRQLEVRHNAIKHLLHEKYEPETLAFFIHLSDPSSHIPDNIFEKVDSYQEHIAKKKKEG